MTLLFGKTKKNGKVAVDDDVKQTERFGSSKASNHASAGRAQNPTKRCSTCSSDVIDILLNGSIKLNITATYLVSHHTPTDVPV